MGELRSNLSNKAQVEDKWRGEAQCSYRGPVSVWSFHFHPIIMQLLPLSDSKLDNQEWPNGRFLFHDCPKSNTYRGHDIQKKLLVDMSQNSDTSKAVERGKRPEVESRQLLNPRVCVYNCLERIRVCLRLKQTPLLHLSISRQLLTHRFRPAGVLEWSRREPALCARFVEEALPVTVPS